MPVDGRSSIGSTNRSARLRDQPKHSERITSLVTMVQLSSSMGWLARVALLASQVSGAGFSSQLRRAAVRYKSTSLDGDHHAVAVQLQFAAKSTQWPPHDWLDCTARLLGQAPVLSLLPGKAALRTPTTLPVLV